MFLDWLRDEVRLDRYKHVFRFTSACQQQRNHLLASYTLFHSIQTFQQTFTGRLRKGLQWQRENVVAESFSWKRRFSAVLQSGKTTRTNRLRKPLCVVGLKCMESVQCWLIQQMKYARLQFSNLKRFDLGCLLCRIVFLWQHCVITSLKQICSFPLIQTVHACQ